MSEYIPFQFRCHAVDIEHSCRHRNEKEPRHPPELLKCVESIVKATQGMLFHGIIKSAANNYQINSNFDSSWIKEVNAAGWKSESLRNLGNLKGIPNIQPDAILSKDNVTIIVEIEKSNKKTIWFDLIKIMMLIGQGVADFGILVGPRNYAHKVGVWDIFSEACDYRWYLAEYAKVDHNLLSRIAIIGYTQEAHISGNWARLDSSVVKSIKEQARQPLSKMLFT